MKTHNTQYDDDADLDLDTSTMKLKAKNCGNCWPFLSKNSKFWPNLDFMTFLYKYFCSKFVIPEIFANGKKLPPPPYPKKHNIIKTCFFLSINCGDFWTNYSICMSFEIFQFNLFYDKIVKPSRLGVINI